MRTLIAGCGFVGSRLARELVDHGEEVIGLRRSAAPLPDGVEVVRADLAAGEGLDALPRDLDAVVYLLSAGAREEEAYRAAYVDGLARLLEHLGEPPRLVFASSTAVYAQQEGEVVDEESATEPRHFSGRILLEGEALARAAGGTVLRFGGIYGPGRRSLIERVARGEARYVPGPPRYTNRIHADDCAGSIRHVLGVESPAGGDVYVGVDEHPAPEREVFEWLAERLGAPAPEPGPLDPQSRRGSANRRASSQKLRRAGYRFRFPTYREGYAALLASEGGGDPVATFRRQ
ncbi:MAG: SDR family oxidoreductase [Myxococcota bacterium]|nr:SDR family oxidoreductase [Myxococcota bacterium]